MLPSGKKSEREVTLRTGSIKFGGGGGRQEFGRRNASLGPRIKKRDSLGSGTLLKADPHPTPAPRVSTSSVPFSSPPVPYLHLLVLPRLPPVGDHQDGHAGDQGHHDHHDDGDEAAGEALHGELGGLLIQVVDERPLQQQGLSAHAHVEAAVAGEQRLALDVPLEVVGGVGDVHVAGDLLRRVLLQLDLDGGVPVVHGRHELGVQRLALPEKPPQLGLQVRGVEGAGGRAVAQVDEDGVGAHQLVAAQAQVALVGACPPSSRTTHGRLVALVRLEAALLLALRVVQAVVVQERVLARPHQGADALPGAHARLEQQALGCERGAVDLQARAEHAALAAATGAAPVAHGHLAGGARAVVLRGRRSPPPVAGAAAAATAKAERGPDPGPWWGGGVRTGRGLASAGDFAELGLRCLRRSPGAWGFAFCF